MLKVILNSPLIQTAPQQRSLNRVRASGGEVVVGGVVVLERNKLRESF